MNKRRWLLHIFERAFEPSQQDEERLQRAILEHVPDGRATRTLLGGLDQPSSLAEQRLVARVAEIPSLHPRRRAPLFGIPAGRLALASAAILGLAVVVGYGMYDHPEPLATALDEHSDSGLAPFPGVHLAYHGGYGELGGTTRSPEIQWVSGQLEVEVEPNRGIQLAVHTEEATVRVIGTRFTVEREDAQTVVGVERGKVEVTCSDGEQVYLTAGEQQSCTSRSPSKLALRAVRMRERGAPPEQVLEVLDRGLETAPFGEAAWSHNSALRMQTLSDLGRDDEALVEAQSYLDAGHARLRHDVLSLALTLSPQPCPIAEAHRQALQAEDANPLFLVTLSDCLQADEPDQARALLERALVAPGLAVQDRAAVQARIEQLR